ncbi:MAG TPA: Mth938-like domain-containing protein [Allosphingosinicella sp.]|nr:Mth938-like domain-containing protein [Allosphingosinicella sp.]
MAPGFERGPAPPGPSVQGFSGGGFIVDGQAYQGVLLTPERAAPWQAPPLSNLTVEALDDLLLLQPPAEFLILGTGASMAFAPPGFVRALEARGIGVEAMDSRAAARTWGVLRAEERWIVAALMPL